MKVLHVCSYYIGSKLYSNMVSNLDELGIENEVYIPINSDKLINKNYVESLSKTNFIYSKAFNTIDRFNFKLKTKKIYQDLLNKVNLDTIDIVHAHSLFVNGYIAYKLKKEKNIDYIVAVRNTDVNVFFKYMPHLRKLGIEIMKNAKKVIFISHAYKKNVSEKYLSSENKCNIKKQFEVLPNGIDRFWIENINNKEKKKVNNDEIRLLYIGELTKNKNIYTIIKVAQNLKLKGYNVQLNLIGKGKEYKKIKKIAYDNKEFIKLHEYMEKEKLIHLYRNSDIFIMPSKYETFGLVYVEAISQGTPIIYTRGQGIDGYFEEGEVGYSVEYNNIVQIESAVLQIINENKSSINISIKSKEFNWYSICKRYMEIYYG